MVQLAAGAVVIRSVQVVVRRAFGRRSTIEHAMNVFEKLVESYTAADLERERRETLRVVAATLRPGGLLIDRRSDGSSITIRCEEPNKEGSDEQVLVPSTDSQAEHGRLRRPPAGPPPKAA